MAGVVKSDRIELYVNGYTLELDERAVRTLLQEEAPEERLPLFAY